MFRSWDILPYLSPLSSPCARICINSWTQQTVLLRSRFEFEGEAERGPGIQSKLRSKLYCMWREDEKRNNTEQRVPLGIKGKNLLWIPFPLDSARSISSFNNKLSRIRPGRQDKGDNVHRSFCPIDCKKMKREEDLSDGHYSRGIQMIFLPVILMGTFCYMLFPFSPYHLE